MGVNQSANENSHLLLAKQTADKYITGNGGNHPKPAVATRTNAQVKLPPPRMPKKSAERLSFFEL